MTYDYARRMTQQFPQTSLRIVRKKELANRLGVDVRTIYRMVKQGRLPKPLYSPSGNITGWLASDLAQWQQR